MAPKSAFNNIRIPLGIIFFSLCTICVFRSLFRKSVSKSTGRSRSASDSSSSSDSESSSESDSSSSESKSKGGNLEPKYLLCLPQGDIVDMCSAIHKCIKYAEKYNRIVIIDSTANIWFNDDINDYIQIHSPHVYTGTAESITEKIKTLKTFPPNINILNPNPTVIEKASKTILTKSYNAPILVFSDNKTEPNSLTKLLEISTFSPKLIYSYKRLSAELPANYVGVCLGNKTQSNAFIEKNDSLLSRNAIYLVTPDNTTIQTFTASYGKRVFSNKSTVNPYEETHKKQNINCFVDLILLAKAKLYLHLSNESGLATEILNLRSNSKLINRLL